MKNLNKFASSCPHFTFDAWLFLYIISIYYIYTYNELLGRAKLPTLYNRSLRDNAVLMYKIEEQFSSAAYSRFI